LKAAVECAHVVPDVTARTLKSTLRVHVDPSVRVMADEMQS